MRWKLIKVEHTDWIQDNSGYYTLINWIDADNVRLDVMSTADDTPVISFQGAASDVRRRIMRYFTRNYSSLSYEHAAYIGAELARCELLGKDYVQD